MLVGLQVFLDIGDARFNLVAIVDMQVTRELAGALIHLDDSLEEFLHAFAAFKGCRYHRDTKQRAECVEFHLIATTLKFVVHVQGAHHADVHIYQLRRQIEVALEVRGVDDVDYHIGHLLRQMFPDIQFLG